MRNKLLHIILLLFAGSFLASPAKAACDSQCVAQAMNTGEQEAQKTVFQELSQGGALGRLIRTEVGLDVCGAKGKSEAVSKLRFARFEKVIGDHVDEHPIGSAHDSEQQANIKFASFISTAKALILGYAVGYKEQTMAIGEPDATPQKAMCQSYRKLADKLLFGDS